MICIDRIICAKNIIGYNTNFLEKIRYYENIYRDKNILEK